MVYTLHYSFMDRGSQVDVIRVFASEECRDTEYDLFAGDPKFFNVWGDQADVE